jgi:hypothetical protein
MSGPPMQNILRLGPSAHYPLKILCWHLNSRIQPIEFKAEHLDCNSTINQPHFVVIQLHLFIFLSVKALRNLVNCFVVLIPNIGERLVGRDGVVEDVRQTYFPSTDLCRVNFILLCRLIDVEPATVCLVDNRPFRSRRQEILHPAKNPDENEY